MSIYKNLIHELLDNVDKTHIPSDIDLVLDSGAFNGVYMYGSLLYIKELEDKQRLKVHRVSGSSVGALFGCLYCLNKIHLIESTYSVMRKNFNNTIHLDKAFAIFEKEISKLDKKAYKLLNNKLHINYIDIEQKKEVVVSTYTSNDDLIDKLRRSTFIPIITNDELTYKNCTDATCPYIFPERIVENKILFIDLWKIGNFKTMINTFYDKNIVGRTIGGIIDTHDFFLKNKPSKMCSYVNDWNLINYSIYRSREFMWLLIVYIIHFITSFQPYIPIYIKNSIYAKTIKDLCLKIIKDFAYCIMSM